MAIAIDLGSTNNTLTLGDADYNVTGTDGSNTLTLGNGTDTVSLGNGNNTLTLANGPDQIVFGAGNNTVTTGSGTDSITATDGNNTITVGDGNDSVVLGNGSDSVTSGNGNSVITAGNGINDNITVGTGSNTLSLGTGTGGVVNTQSGGNTLSIAAGSLGGDSILGNLSGTGIVPNTLVLTTAGIANAANVSGFGVYNLAPGGATTLGLTDANFTRVPGASIKVVEASGGSTVDASAVSAANSVSVYLGAGANIANGGAGADFFYGAPGDQSVVNGGAGYDSMIFSAPRSDYTITTTDGVITVVGNGENDTLTSIENILFNGNVTAALTSDTGTSNTDGITTSDALNGTAEAGSIVSISEGNAVVGTTTADANGVWAFTPTGLADGNHTVTASETNQAGITSSASVAFTLLTAAPVVTVMLGAYDGAVSSDDIILTGTAQSNGAVTIENGGTAIATVTADASGNWNYTTGAFADGTYALTASQTDAAGNTGAATVAVTLDHIYTGNVNDIDDTSTVFVVLDKPGSTANIDLTNNTQPVTVFGGGADLNLTAGNALVIMNGPGQTNAATIHSLGNDFVWGGQSTIDVDGVSGNRMVLSGTGPTSGTLNLNTAGSAFNLIDVGGTTGTTETINNLGSSATEIFGGSSDIAFTGSNSLIIVNGAGQTGNLTVQSTGGNTVWTGISAVTFNEGTSGSDTVVLAGSGTTVVHGTFAPSTGTTTIADDGGTGRFEYDGGTKAASISIGQEQATVFGGTAGQTVNLNGNGSLIMANSDTVSGLQTVVVAPGSTGSLEFWGGYASNDTAITLGAGGAFVQAGGGNDTLTGGSGNFSLDLAASVNTLVNIDGSKSGAVNIMGYTGSNATLNMTNVDSQAVVGGSLVMHLHDGSSVTFQSYVPNANQASGAHIG